MEAQFNNGTGSSHGSEVENSLLNQTTTAQNFIRDIKSSNTHSSSVDNKTNLTKETREEINILTVTNDEKEEDSACRNILSLQMQPDWHTKESNLEKGHVIVTYHPLSPIVGARCTVQKDRVDWTRWELQSIQSIFKL
jgi:hypothetical protein